MAPRNPYEFTRDEYNALVRKIPHPIYSQRSDYEEIELVEDCTLYDLYRQPRQPVTDPAVTRTLPVRVLNADLTCPICLGIIRKTEVVMECLHRFCGECIQRSLRVGKRECPSCRMHIPSKRSLRPDKNFDDLIAKIYPNLDEFNEQEEKLIAELNKRHFSNNSMTESTKKGVQNQQEIRRNGGKKKLSSDADASPSSETSSPNSHSDKRDASWANAAAESNGTTSPDGSDHASDVKSRKRQRTLSNGSSSTTSTVESTGTDGAAKEQADDKVNVRVLVHPEEGSDVPKLTRTLFRTGYQLKIRHLKKHLISLLKLNSIENMRIVLAADNCVKSGLSASEKSGAAIRKDLKYDQELEDYVTLHDIYEQYGMGTKWELLLYYHFSDTILNGVAQFIASGV